VNNAPIASDPKAAPITEGVSSNRNSIMKSHNEQGTMVAYE